MNLVRLSLLSVAVALGCYSVAHSAKERLNLGFENGSKGASPTGWYAGGGGKGYGHLSDYIGVLDDSVVHSGRFSLHFIYKQGEGNGVGTVGQDILKDVRGKTVTYSGWIKTKNISRMAGLWFRVDGPDGVLAMNTMHDSAVNGTKDWTRYSFDLFVDSSATNINFGVLVQGPGDAWFDDLALDTNGHRYAPAADKREAH